MTQMGWEPMPGRILVRRVAAEEKTAGGIIKAPGSVEADRPYHGVVVALGGEGYFEAKLAIGDEVAYNRHGGTVVELDGFSQDGKHEQLMVLKESEIFCRRSKKT